MDILVSAKSLCVAKVELIYELKTSAIAIGSLSQNDDYVLGLTTTILGFHFRQLFW